MAAFKALYTVIQASVSQVETVVSVNGADVKALVPSLVVQMSPQDSPNDNSVIKLILPGVTEQAPFTTAGVGGTVEVTFAAK
jgi:hypothetical protein